MLQVNVLQQGRNHHQGVNSCTLGNNFVTYQIWGAISVYWEAISALKILIIPKMKTILPNFDPNNLMHFRHHGS